MLSHLVLIKKNNLNPDSPAGVRTSVYVSLCTSGSQVAFSSLNPPAWPFIPAKTWTLAQKKCQGNTVRNSAPSTHLSPSSTCLLVTDASSCFCCSQLNPEPQPMPQAWLAASTLPTLGFVSAVSVEAAPPLALHVHICGSSSTACLPQGPSQQTNHTTTRVLSIQAADTSLWSPREGLCS